MPTDTLFAVSLLIGEGGDGCAATGMNRISADARRLFDPGLSSPFGLQMRNEGACTAQYDPTGRGAQPSGGPVTKREMWERVFIRLRKFPTSGSPDPIVWALKGNVESGPALCLRINGSGTLSLYNQGNATAPGELLDSVGLSLDIWYCVEIHARFNNAVEVPPNPPYENNALVAWRINGDTISTHDRAGLNPQYGIDRRNQEALQSKLGDSTNVGKGLEVDYSDWIADGADWVGQSRRVTVLRPTGAGTHTGWTGGNPDYRHQLDFPFIGAGINLGVSTQSASVSQTYAVESAESKGVEGAIYSARIAVYFSAVGGANVELILRRNGSESLYNIGSPPHSAWSTWRISTAGWVPGDTLEVGVKNSPSPAGSTAIEACALLVEHDTAGSAEGDQDRAVRVIQTTYTGNATQQSINLAAIDPDVASLTPCLVLVFPESGTSAGAWWWDSKVYTSQCNNAGALSYALIVRPGIVHITGSNSATNQNTITYRLIACFDPQQRIASRGAVALASGSDDRDVQLRGSGFVPEAVFIARESAPSNDATKIYYRGAGHTGDQSISLGVDTAAVSNAVQTVQTGGFEVGTLINEAFQDFAFMAWRTTPFAGRRLVAITSYVGNGSNPRSVSLALDGGTPVFALVVPTNNGKRWTRYGTVTRQWNGTTTGSGNAITAFGADSMTVGSELNANGVTYSVFGLATGVDEAPVLKSVTFDSGWGLLKDDGSAYGEPQWQDSPLREYPYLMKEGSTLKIKEAQILIPNPLAGATYLFRGLGTGGINVPSTTATAVGGDVFEITNVDASTAFPSGATAFYNPFEIAWEVSRDGGSSWQSAGVSKTPLYLCLSNSGPLAVARYHTVVHLACSNVGATDAATAVAKTWELFSSLDLKTWDGIPLYYYKPGTTFDLSENPITVGGLLQVHSGECVAWAHMLQDAWTVNGVSSAYTIATSQSTAYFWVKNWSNLGSQFYFQSLAHDMIPYPDGNTERYGYYDAGSGTEFKNEPEIPGQNTGSDAPSEKVFANHQFIKYGGTYYDPSYGVTYAGSSALEASISGYGNFSSNVDGKRTLTFSTSGSITFDV
jgi:hypothetical protein